MTQLPPPGDLPDPSDRHSGAWADPYAASPGGGQPTQQPVTPAYPTTAYSTPAVPPGYGQAYPYPVALPTNGLAIAAMVCSLAGLATGISAPVGAILGHVARRQIKERGEQGDGMALTGIIVGWVVTGLYALCCVGYVGFFGWAISQDPGSF